MRSFRVIAPAIHRGCGGRRLRLRARMPASVKATNGILTDAKGMTLYTWDKDKEANKSACNGKCIMNWPALMAGAADKDMGDWKVITRVRRFEADRLQGQAALLLRAWTRPPAIRSAKAKAWSGTSPSRNAAAIFG